MPIPKMLVQLSNILVMIRVLHIQFLYAGGATAEKSLTEKGNHRNLSQFSFSVARKMFHENIYENILLWVGKQRLYLV